MISVCGGNVYCWVYYYYSAIKHSLWECQHDIIQQVDLEDHLRVPHGLFLVLETFLRISDSSCLIALLIITSSNRDRFDQTLQVWNCVLLALQILHTVKHVHFASCWSSSSSSSSFLSNTAVSDGQSDRIWSLLFWSVDMEFILICMSKLFTAAILLEKSTACGSQLSWWTVRPTVERWWKISRHGQDTETRCW